MHMKMHSFLIIVLGFPVPTTFLLKQLYSHSSFGFPPLLDQKGKNGTGVLLRVSFPGALSMKPEAATLQHQIDSPTAGVWDW